MYFRAGMGCPDAVLKATKALFDGAREWHLAPERFAEFDAFMATASQLGHELRAYDDAIDFVAGQRDAVRRALARQQIFPLGVEDQRLKSLLKVTVYPYQAEAALFAVRAGRVLIGDEMGLGKTIQAFATAEILARHFGISKVLVICPTSLKYQWQSEIARFPGRESRVMAGGRALRMKDFTLDDFCKITNYEKHKPDLDFIAA